MSMPPIAIHTITNKPWSLRECVDAYVRSRVAGISVWRECYADIGVTEAHRILSESGLSVPALVRGGFFVSLDSDDRRQRIEENLRCIEEAAALQADMLVLVPGASPGVDLNEQRRFVCEGIEAILPAAQGAGVKLALEPLHPMYAADRACVSTMRQANDLCDRIDHELVGIAVDVYHTWWDDELESEIARAGRCDRLFAFHINDWRVPTRSFLTDRAMMGNGCIPLRRIFGWMMRSGFEGFVEIEILSEDLWDCDQSDVLANIMSSCEMIFG